MTLYINLYIKKHIEANCNHRSTQKSCLSIYLQLISDYKIHHCFFRVCIFTILLFVVSLVIIIFRRKFCRTRSKNLAQQNKMYVVNSIKPWDHASWYWHLNAAEDHHIHMVEIILVLPIVTVFVDGIVLIE